MDLINIVTENIINDVFDKLRNDIQKKYRILVVDPATLKIINSCFYYMSVLDNHRIILVDILHKNREPYPSIEAVYYITPTENSIAALIEDFRYPAAPMYRLAHVYFTEACNEVLFTKLRYSVANKIDKIVTLKEINISFIPYESQVFCLDCPETFHIYYNPLEDKNLPFQIFKIAEKIATVCTALSEYPTVRYSSNFKKNAELAQMVQKRLDWYKNEDQSMGDGPEKAHSQLIIIDRGFDCMSPVLHELTFQAMVYDLLPIKDNSLKNKDNADDPTEKIMLDVKTDLWRELSHLYIGDFLKNLAEKSKEFVGSKSKETIEKATKSSLKDIIQTMPDFMKRKKLLEDYSKCAQYCFNIYNNYVGELHKIEQNLMTDINETNGKRFNHHYNSIVQVFKDFQLSNNEKMRLIILYVLVKNGISEINLNKLIECAKLTSKEKQTIVNLNLLGLTSLIGVNDGNTKKKHKIPRKDPNSPRWTPMIKDLIEQCIENKLDDKHFPQMSGRFASGHNNAKRSKYVGNWYDKKSKKKLPRIILFVVGGITMSEIRSVYEASKEYKNYEIIIGSTEILTPDDFIKNMSAFNS